MDSEFPLPGTITAIKSVKQSLQPTPELLQLMETFRRMVNDCIRIGLQNGVSSMKRLSKLSYK
jgi:putative transposase